MDHTANSEFVSRTLQAGRWIVGIPNHGGGWFWLIPSRRHAGHVWVVAIESSGIAHELKRPVPSLEDVQFVLRHTLNARLDGCELIETAGAQTMPGFTCEDDVAGGSGE